MKIFCVNLPRDVERRKKMEGELEKLSIPVEFIEGVDGRKLTDEELKNVYAKWRTRFRHGKDLSRGELGCALSHVKFYDEMIRGADEVGMVVEDDVSFGEEIFDALCEVERFLKATDDPAIVQLPGLKRDLPQGDATDMISVKFAMGTYAYAINRAGAELLKKEFTPVKMPIDRYNYLIKHCGLKFYVYPKIVLSVDMEGESSVGQDRFIKMNAPVMALYKAWRMMGVLIDRVLS